MRISLRIVLVLLVGGMAFCCLYLVRDRDARLHAEGYMWSKTAGRMSLICKLIILAEDDMDEPIPVTMSELIDWLAKSGYADTEYDSADIDFQQKMIQDAWGNPLKVLSDESGRFIGFGSAGPNGLWQNGQGDDIIVTVDEVKNKR